MYVQVSPILSLLQANPHPAHFHQTETVYHFAVELPGVPPEAISLEAAEASLTLQAEYEAADGRKRSFRYTIALPSDVDLEQVAATAKHGVLTVDLPRSAAKMRRIPIAS